MYFILTIFSIIWLVSLSGYLISLVYWPLTLFITWAFALKDVSINDFRMARSTEIVALIFFGIPIYGLISLAIAFAISWIDELYFSGYTEISSWLGVILILIFGRVTGVYKFAVAVAQDQFQQNRIEKILDKLLKKQSEDPYYFVSNLTGIAKEIIHKTPRDYSYIDLAKKTGGYRRLSIPNAELKLIQSKLAGFIEKKFSDQIHHCCHAYLKDRSIFSNAVPHLGCEVLIKLDIKDYFGSVTENQVLNAIRLGERSASFDHNYPAFKTYFPSRLKTIPDYLSDDQVKRSILSILVNDRGLPQGAPSSPILANLLLKDFDQEVFLVVKSMGGRYTRYSDDLTISFEEDDSDKIARVIKFVEFKLLEYGFKLNKKKGKIQVLRKHQAQRICGVTINSGRPTISRKQRRLIRAAEHNKGLGKEISFTDQQLQGHIGFQSYIQLKGARLKKKCRTNSEK